MGGFVHKFGSIVINKTGSSMASLYISKVFFKRENYSILLWIDISRSSYSNWLKLLASLTCANGVFPAGFGQPTWIGGRRRGGGEGREGRRRRRRRRRGGGDGREGKRSNCGTNKHGERG